jgi:hypothetical protein
MTMQWVADADGTLLSGPARKRGGIGWEIEPRRRFGEHGPNVFVLGMWEHGEYVWIATFPTLEQAKAYAAAAAG